MPARRSAPLRLPSLLGAGTVAMQVAYPLVPRGRPRDRLTVATVVAFSATSTAHAAATRGPRAATALVLLAGGGGFAVEVLGTATGRPFGRYTYAGNLGPRVAGVPVVIGLAWTMMAWPALLAGRRLAGSRPGTAPLVSAVALAGWDVFLDPQMVAAGHWRWSEVGTTLPGIPDVPLTNFAGWLGAAGVLMVALHRAVPDGDARHDALPFGLYLWTYGSSVLANLAFWRRPAVAVAGGLAMGVVAVPLAAALWRRG